MIDLSEIKSIDDILTSSPTGIVDDAVREYNSSRNLIRERDSHAVQQASLWAKFGGYVVGAEY